MNVGEARHLADAEAQKVFGARLAPWLARGAVVFLEGELGSGKTTLVQGLVGALGFEGEVSSPTYALMQLYPTPEGTVLHADAYRVRHPGELYAMELERLIEESRLSVIEWGQPFYADFPDAWRLVLTYADDGGRVVTRVQ